MSKITKRDVDAFYGQLSEGSVMVCTANTYREGAVGSRIRVDRVGKSFVDGFDHDHPGGRRGAWRVTRPTRVRDVVSVDGRSITYKIGQDEHTATWEIVPCGS